METKISFITFLKKILIINIIGYGGAPLTISYYKEDFVNTNIITNEELNQYVALGNVLPGALSFYLCGYIGNKLFGKKGLTLGVLTCVIPIMLITLVVYNLLKVTKIDFSFLIIVVLPIIIINTIKYLLSLYKAKIDNILKYSMFLISLILLFFFSISSINLVILFLIFIYIFSKTNNSSKYIKEGIL